MRVVFIMIVIALAALNTVGQQLYFPPTIGTNWDTTQPQTLGWCPDRIDSLYAFLDAKHTKAFIVLKDGRMVLEKYFGTFSQDSVWYWASAGKSLTAFMIGQAQEQGYLNINDTTSQYLGIGWTSATAAQEQAITIRHQLTMTTGLDENVPDDHCFDDTCLLYLADAGTRWAYHNALYTLLHQVLENTTGVSTNAFCNANIGSHIGMYGLWLWSGNDHVYFSTARAMARFGLLNLNHGIWNSDTLLHDQTYIDAMTNSSQPLNLSYGYLWWLNGKGSYMLPQSQLVFNTDLIPNAPDDLYAALGKNDQKIYVVPSQGLVVVRIGNSADQSLYALSSFDNQLWEYISNLSCSNGLVDVRDDDIFVYPNPVANELRLQGVIGDAATYTIHDALGRNVLHGKCAQAIHVSKLVAGVYVLCVQSETGTSFARFVKQ
jgi:CubicO group peptidase (beta-lactamase class C family)